MKIAEPYFEQSNTFHVVQPRWTVPLAKPNFLCLVMGTELADLRDSLARGVIPADFVNKLSRMAGEHLTFRFIEQNCRLFLALLATAQDGLFTEASPADRDRLLRVLAYVRKDDDHIPDYRRDGLVDDQQEIRAALNELGPVLHTFKAWRLQHQVPRMWLDRRVSKTKRL